MAAPMPREQEPVLRLFFLEKEKQQQEKGREEIDHHAGETAENVVEQVIAATMAGLR